MPATKSQAARRHTSDAPELLIAYLQYALADVRVLSERSGSYLEKAIETLSEDISVIDVANAVGARHHS